MTTLYPRLPDHEGRLLIRQFDGLPLADIKARAQLNHPGNTYAPTGGVPASTEHLKECAAVIRDCAANHGYPSTAPGLRAGTSFDRALAPLLHRTMDLVPAEAAAPEVWTYVACQLVPDVVMWRWSMGNQERWLGRGLVRHAFGRLWWQAQVLVDEAGGVRDYRLIGRLSEADLNQVFERRTIGGVPPLARALAHELSTPAVDAADVPRRDVVRDVTKRLRRLLPYTSFLGIDESTVRRRVAELVHESIQQLSVSHNGSP
ncbi:DUF6339 family protein [Actinophytocola sp.]|uniref:DUF6339 family protein n=1 Tax=Actinophytocola sp. TaxID=1872138 RepID=UPI00389A00A0